MSAQLLILNGLAQSDLNMNGFRLLNLDLSNLPIFGLPPTVTPPAHNFLNGWNQIGLAWSYAQVDFTDLSGSLTNAQQTAITQLGVITTGTWNGTQIDENHLPTLDGIRAPVSDMFFNNLKLTAVANPVAATDAVNLQTLQSLVSGFQPKAAVAAATTTNTHPAGLNPIDGYTPLVGDRILIKDQITGAHYQNGIWVAAAGSWARSSDGDAAGLVGALVPVLNGAVNGGTSWVQIAPAPIDITGPDDGTHEPLFVLFNHPQNIVAGAGLVLMGNVMSAVGTPNRIAVTSSIDIAANYAGQSSINTVGSVTSGIWLAKPVGPAYGGTGFINPSGGISLAGKFWTQQLGGPPITCDLIFQLSGSTELVLPLTGTLATLDGDETLTNKSIDASEIDTGFFNLAQGGTGATNALDAIKNLLPPMAGNAGLALRTDGVNTYWG
jgi:hypothetical protein